jgi:hypothetical protein
VIAVAIHDTLQQLPEPQRLALMAIVRGMGLAGMQRQDFDAIRAHLRTRLADALAGTRGRLDCASDRSEQPGVQAVSRRARHRAQ